MKSWILLAAGPVVFGACAVKRHTETTHQANADMARKTDHVVLRLDSLTGIRDRSMVHERHWEYTRPQTGAVYRYVEQIRSTDRDSMTVNRSLAAETQRETQIKMETQESRTAVREVSGRHWRWLWWTLGIVALAWLIRKAIRFWPFSHLRIRGK